MIPPAPIFFCQHFLAPLPVLLWLPAQIGSLLLVTRWLPVALASCLPLVQGHWLSMCLLSKGLSKSLIVVSPVLIGSSASP